MVAQDPKPENGKEPLEFEGLRRQGAKGKSALAGLPGWSKWAAIGVVVAIGLILAIVGIGGELKSAEPAKEPAAGTEAPEAAETGQSAEVELSTGKWVVMTLIDGSSVYGEIADPGIEGFTSLKSAYFVAEAGEGESDENVLRRFGGEMYSPVPNLLIPLESILMHEPLAADSEALKAIEANEASSPISGAASFAGGKMSALFMVDGQVFFGALSVDEGTVVLKEAHFLRYVDEDAAELGTIESLDQVNLVPRSATASHPSGDLFMPADSVLYVQTLSDESPVVKALADAKK